MTAVVIGVCTGSSEEVCTPHRQVSDFRDDPRGHQHQSTGGIFFLFAFLSKLDRFTSSPLVHEPYNTVFNDMSAHHFSQVAPHSQHRMAYAHLMRHFSRFFSHYKKREEQKHQLTLHTLAYFGEDNYMLCAQWFLEQEVQSLGHATWSGSVFYLSCQRQYCKIKGEKTEVNEKAQGVA